MGAASNESVGNRTQQQPGHHNRAFARLPPVPTTWPRRPSAPGSGRILPARRRREQPRMAIPLDLRQGEHLRQVLHAFVDISERRVRHDAGTTPGLPFAKGSKVFLSPPCSQGTLLFQDVGLFRSERPWVRETRVDHIGGHQMSSTCLTFSQRSTRLKRCLESL
jgi:hypothetical protein